ncbi:MAG: hypothetical protein KY476_00095 [Planctomycetes bacterium]|nr:hypothetical protein [Planctomycetota bacterium]
MTSTAPLLDRGMSNDVEPAPRKPAEQPVRLTPRGREVLETLNDLFDAQQPLPTEVDRFEKESASHG